MANGPHTSRHLQSSTSNKEHVTKSHYPTHKHFKEQMQLKFFSENVFEKHDKNLMGFCGASPGVKTIYSG